jgi:hypothetical protein
MIVKQYMTSRIGPSRDKDRVTSRHKDRVTFCDDEGVISRDDDGVTPRDEDVTTSQDKEDNMSHCEEGLTSRDADGVTLQDEAKQQSEDKTDTPKGDEHGKPSVASRCETGSASASRKPSTSHRASLVDRRSSSAMPKLPGLAHLILTDKIDGGRISIPSEPQREVSEADTDGSIPDLTEIFPPPRRKKMRQNLDRTAMIASATASADAPEPGEVELRQTHS